MIIRFYFKSAKYANEMTVGIPLISRGYYELETFVFLYGNQVSSDSTQHEDHGALSIVIFKVTLEMFPDELLSITSDSID